MLLMGQISFRWERAVRRQVIELGRFSFALKGNGESNGKNGGGHRHSDTDVLDAC